MKKLVFNFKSKDSKKIKITANILGGKGANLEEMGRLGYPVPSGFTISTEVCDLFYKNNKKISPNILKQIKAEIKNIEKDVKKGKATLIGLLGYRNTIKYNKEIKKNIFKKINKFGKKANDLKETINFILNRTK